MTQQEQPHGLITIGVDPHKYSWTAVAVDSQGAAVAMPTRVDATDNGFRRLVRWSRRWPLHQWAVENARGMGRDLAQRLLQRHERVVDVPAKLSTRVRLLASGHPRKTDPADARAIATAALHASGLHAPLAEDDATVLRLLSDRRDELVRQRTQAVNRLHVLVVALVPGRHRGKLSADAATRLLEDCRPTGSANRTRLLLAQDLIDETAALSQRIASPDQRITQQVRAVGTALTELVGISHLTAAKILGRVVDVRRFATAAAFAAYCGTAPREVSSGDRPEGLERLLGQARRFDLKLSGG
ncbi:IS110 family transposase [Streptomyces sp. NPDC056468]|uniref:IS110 family transposase n=1 Tax=Streptomyces sp. NPDC056468 TaxID=3345830 RepID=UPI0036A18C33